MPRHQVISGWDVAEDRPKPAQKVVPAGAVYSFERRNGDLSALSELLQEGLWPLFGDEAKTYPWAQRRAEGFNNVLLGDCRTA